MSEVTLEVLGQDDRVSNRDRISSRKNGDGIMETACILAANDVVVEVTNAVRTELQCSPPGFTIGEGC